MNCPSAEELIQKSLDAPLTSPERARLDVHVQECPACRRAWKEYRLLSRVADDWVSRPSPTEMPASEFTAQVLSRVAQRAPARLSWGMAVLATGTVALLSPLAAPWLPSVPHWDWPSLETSAFWTAAMGAGITRWAEALLLPALAVNVVLLRRARRTA